MPRPRSLAISVALAMLGALALAATPVGAAFPGTDGPIVYSYIHLNEGADSGGLRIHGPTLKPHAKSLTTNPTDNDPAFSPNGRLVAFSRSTTNEGPAGTNIWVVRVNGSGVRRLTTGITRDGEPTFSANGKEIVFSRESNGGPRTIHLFEVPLAGGEPKQLTSGPGFDTEPVVTPDGKRIVFTSIAKSDARADIYSMPAAGGARKLLVGGARNQDGADVSPNGKLLAFSSNLHGGPQIYTARIDGSHQKAVTHSRHGCSSSCFFSPAFSPDGTHLVFERLGRESSDVVVTRLDGTNSKEFEEAGTEEEGFGSAVGPPAWGRATR